MHQFRIKDTQSRLEDLIEPAIEGNEVLIIKEDTFGSTIRKAHSGADAFEWYSASGD